MVVGGGGGGGQGQLDSFCQGTGGGVKTILNKKVGGVKEFCFSFECEGKSGRAMINAYLKIFRQGGHMEWRG